MDEKERLTSKEEEDRFEFGVFFRLVVGEYMNTHNW